MLLGEQEPCRIVRSFNTKPAAMCLTVNPSGDRIIASLGAKSPEITCWSVSDGSLQWRTPVPPGTVSNRSTNYANHRCHGIVSSDIGAVYWTVSGEKGAHCGSLVFLNAKGSIIARQCIPATIKTAFMVEDTVITLGQDSHLRAFNVAGELRWSYLLPPSGTGFYYPPHLLPPVDGRIGCARGEMVFIFDLAGNILCQWQFPTLTRPSVSCHTFGLTDEAIPLNLDFGDGEDEGEKIQPVFNVGVLHSNGRLFVQGTSGQFFELAEDGEAAEKMRLPSAKGYFFIQDNTVCIFTSKSIFFIRDFQVLKKFSRKPNTFGQLFIEDPGCYIFWGGYEVDSGHLSIFTPEGTPLVAHDGVLRPRCAASFPKGVVIAYPKRIDVLTLEHLGNPVTKSVGA